MTTERCVLCGELVAPDEPDAVEIGGGLVHEGCVEELGDERRLFGEPDPESTSSPTGCAAAFECSVAEIARERRQRAARRAKERRKAG